MATLTLNPSPSKYLPSFKNTVTDEEAADAERRAELLRAATSRVTARVLGVHAWSGDASRRTEIRPTDFKRVKKLAVGSADRLLLIQAAALKSRAASQNIYAQGQTK